MRAQGLPWEDSVMRRLFSTRALFLTLLVFLVPAASRAQVSVGVSVRLGPPALPVYEQPACPVEGYMWTPGYWAYGDEGYYWVPGVWVRPPQVGLLWTPGYWGWGGACMSSTPDIGGRMWASMAE